KDDPQSFSGSVKWKVSHGTPEVKDLYGNLFFKLAKLKAEKSSSGQETNEGLFISYNFQCTHSYDITVALRHGDGDKVGFKLKAANGLKEQSNTTCALGAKQVAIKE